MKTRILYGVGIAALSVLVTLLVWQGSFEFGAYGPATPTQTALYWAVSTLVFLLTVLIGFILFRTGVKLYIERRTNREGSRIKTKLVIGALALSFLPVFFLVLWSVYVLNRNLDKWFSRPAERIKVNLQQEVAPALARETRKKLEAQAALLASLPETQSAAETGQVGQKFFQDFCGQKGLRAAYLERPDGTRIALCPGMMEKSFVVAKAPAGKATLMVAAPAPVDLAQKQQEIESYLRAYDELALNRRSANYFYLQLLFLLTLFILFVATWIALILARQISVPISALLAASGEIRKGNLGHRVDVKAIDELATLVRSFNEMAHSLEQNSRELEARRRFIEAILESIPTGVISLAPDGEILRVNGALKKILPEERIAKAWRLEDLFSREDTAEIKYLMKRAQRIGVASSQLDLQTEHQMLHLAVTVSALEATLTSGFVLVVEDTSELLRAQRAAAWREVARRIAHEIKNPLTPISLSAQRITRQLERFSVSSDADRIVRECTATIAQEVESLKTLVDEFSQFARFPASQPVPADLNEVVESALSLFAGRLDGIELRTNLGLHLPVVHIDREQFTRVVTNLVDNAAESMQESLVKQLFVGTRATVVDSVELIVADTGGGISPEDKEKLFLPYFSTKGRGTGLGLAIVSHILSDHRAHIRVEDNVPAGARFIVEIPVPVAAEVEA